MKQLFKNTNFLRFSPVFPVVFLSIFILFACNRNKNNELYHFFQDKTWNRYHKLSFELPVSSADEAVDVILFGNLAEEYEFETLDFNMILQTPSGEERINEYQIKIKGPSGSFLGKKTKSGYYYEFPLKRQLRPGKQGKMVIEIENLVPRLVTNGIEGIGIRLIPFGK